MSLLLLLTSPAGGGGVPDYWSDWAVAGTVSQYGGGGEWLGSVSGNPMVPNDVNTYGSGFYGVAEIDQLVNSWTRVARFTNFGFVVPTGMTVVGVEVIAYLNNGIGSDFADGELRDDWVRLCHSGSARSGERKKVSSDLWPKNQNFDEFIGRMWGG